MIARPSPDGRRRAALTTAAGAVVGGLLLGAWALLRGEAASPASESAAATIAATVAAPASASEVRRDPTDEAATVRESATTPTTVELRDFAAEVAALVAQGCETSRLAQGEEFEAARASDDRARARFAAILDGFDRVAERALELAARPRPQPPDDAQAMTLTVLGMLFDGALGRETIPTARDAAVGAALATVALADDSADAFVPLLLRDTRLHLPHEAGVLDLVAAAGRGEFARDHATRLLLTLWQNLQQLGERSSTELANLALVALDDADPSRRTVACRQLVGDERFRPLVLAWLREHQDLEVADEVARLAALELPPAQALATLRELAPLIQSSPALFMALGHRAPETLADAYEQLLADAVQPGVRRDLIAGLGMNEGEATVAMLRLALDHDPNPAVRLQAALSLSACAPQSHGEEACRRMVEDPAIGNDPVRLGVVLMALQNLEVAGLTNAVDRVGRRLAATPLDETSRRRLAELLQRALPPGR